jgi:hypothetical protein
VTYCQTKVVAAATFKQEQRKLEQAERITSKSKGKDQEKESPNQYLCPLCRYSSTKFFTPFSQ